jgi:carbamoyl-phosphate synthase large subunit
MKTFARSRNKGFADRQIAHMMGCLESAVHTKRAEMDVNRVFKLVDYILANLKRNTLLLFYFEAQIES